MAAMLSGCNETRPAVRFPRRKQIVGRVPQDPDAGHLELRLVVHDNNGAMLACVERGRSLVLFELREPTKEAYTC